MKCLFCNSEIPLANKGRIRFYGLVILVLFCIVGFLFYWYEWRPTQIRKECAKLAEESAIEAYIDEAKEALRDSLNNSHTGNTGGWDKEVAKREKERKFQVITYEHYYERLLREKGLEK